MSDLPPLVKVVREEYVDDVTRRELLECGHWKTTLVVSDRPAYRRRCVKCAADQIPTREDPR